MYNYFDVSACLIPSIYLSIYQDFTECIKRKKKKKKEEEEKRKKEKKKKELFCFVFLQDDYHHIDTFSTAR